jgi:hypothetical protein
MTSFNLYEAYAAVYDEDLREDILAVEEDFSFIDDLSDNELDQVMEEVIVEENLNLNECFEMFDNYLTEATVTVGRGDEDLSGSKAKTTSGQGSVMAARERVAARKAKRKETEKAERSQRRAERVERIKGSISRVAGKIGRGLKVGAEKAKRALTGRDSGSERKVRQAKIKMRDVARRNIGRATTMGKGQKRPPAVTTGKTERASSGDYTPPSKEATGKQVKTAAKKSTSLGLKNLGRGGSSGRINFNRSQSKRVVPISSSGKELTGSAREASVAATRRSPGQTEQERQETHSTGRGVKKRSVAEDFELLASYILEDLINEGYAETFEEAFEVLESFSDYEVGELAENYLSEEVETVDLYDVVLEHLVTEGYADTKEAATVIMANMSEEWRNEILENL